MNNQHFSPAECLFLEKYYLAHTPQELLAALPGRTWVSIRSKAHRLQLGNRPAGKPGWIGPLPELLPLPPRAPTRPAARTAPPKRRARLTSPSKPMPKPASAKPSAQAPKPVKQAPAAEHTPRPQLTPLHIKPPVSAEHKAARIAAPTCKKWRAGNMSEQHDGELLRAFRVITSDPASTRPFVSDARAAYLNVGAELKRRGIYPEA